MTESRAGRIGRRRAGGLTYPNRAAADIAKFFDSVSKEWLARFLEHRIGDKRVLRLIQKWLRAGVLEDGRIEVPERGTGQGAAISPLLANVYLLLRPRSVGRALATARSQGRHGH